MSQPTPIPSVRQSKSRFALYMVILVCLAPVFASYYFYYIDPPEGRTNSGTLILPPLEVLAHPVQVTERPKSESGFLDVLAQRAAQAATASPILEPGQPATLGSFQGRWLMVWVGPDPCADPCMNTLLEIRQIRLTTGRDRDRVERLWLRVAPAQAPAAQPLPPGLEGTWVLTTEKDPSAMWQSRLPDGQRAAAPQGFWLIDPQGNLMMHFPPSVDPAKIKKDLIRLLKASRVG
ncbi:MAG: hypothetical protein RLY30_724 [Pseudomonadota bacterium]